MELKPCPFCGGSAEVALADVFEWAVRCTGCGICQAEYVGGGGFSAYGSEEEAIKAWNQRTEQEVDGG